jgi:hypothetical protein
MSTIDLARIVLGVVIAVALTGWCAITDSGRQST